MSNVFEDYKIFAGNSNTKLAEEIAATMDVQSKHIDDFNTTLTNLVKKIKN